MLLSGVFSLLQFSNPAKAFEQMLASVYATLGVFLIIAAFNPQAHRSLIAFTAWSSVVHGAVMGVQSWKGVIPHGDLWRASLPMLAIGVVFLLLAPGRSPPGVPLRLSKSGLRLRTERRPMGTPILWPTTRLYTGRTSDSTRIGRAGKRK